MAVLKTQNLAYEIAEILMDRIIRMELNSGKRLIESKIAHEMDVSQSSVREALRILEKNGLVEINQRRGTYVTELSVANIDIMYDIVSELYCLLIRKAMEQKTESNVRELLDVIQKLEESAQTSNVEEYYKNIFEIATVALRAVDSSLLKNIILDLWPNKRRVEYITLKYRKDELMDNLKYFNLLKKYMVEANVNKLTETMRDYTQNEKMIAISIVKAQP
jgi:DNA-binding GntR family transcriptional regulator